MWSSWPWSLEIVVERLGASGRWYNLHHSHFVHGGCVILYFNNVEANVLVVCLALVVLLVSSCCCLLTFLSLQTPSAWVCLPSIAHRAREYCRRVFRLIYPCFACISPKGRRGGGGIRDETRSCRKEGFQAYGARLSLAAQGVLPFRWGSEDIPHATRELVGNMSRLETWLVLEP